MKLVQTAKIPFIAMLAVFALAGCSGQSGSNSSGVDNVKKVDDLNEPDPDADLAGAENTPSGGSAVHPGTINLRRNFYFVFDGSGSMKDAPPASAQGDHSFKSKIEGAKWAVNEFMKNVPENVNLGLFVFDAKGERQVLPLGPNNRNEFLSAINAVHAHGGTPLGDAISKGTVALENEYKKQMGYGEYRLIVITDGEAEDNIDSGIAKAAKYKIPIYTIGFGIGPNHSLRNHSVSYRSADSAKEVENALEEAAAELDVFDAPSFKKK